MTLQSRYVYVLLKDDSITKKKIIFVVTIFCFSFDFDESALLVKFANILRAAFSTFSFGRLINFEQTNF